MKRHKTMIMFWVLCALGLLPACSEEPPRREPGGVYISTCYSVPQSARPPLDLLFIIDSSPQMAVFQPNLRAQTSALITELRNMAGGLPDLHIGVVTTDLGAGPYHFDGCSEGGDRGRFHVGACPSPIGRPYLVDVRPSGCMFSHDEAGYCTEHNCIDVNCGHEPGTALAIDAATGCPRCRSYDGQSLEDAFSCRADVGTDGCEYSQPLEAMKLALESPDNAGFLRDDSHLFILFITAQDDCSASVPGLFNPTAVAIDSPLGPPTPFRCFEFGVECDESDRTQAGIWQDCEPREDAAALLHPISRYTQFLQTLKDPQMLVVAAIAGPVTPSPSGEGHNMVVGLDDLSQPALQASCTMGEEGAVPAIRIFNLVETFNHEADIAQWAYTAVCSTDYSPSLQGASGCGVDRITDYCVPLPLRGCTDPAAAEGLEGDGQACNDDCRPFCVVTEVAQRGLPGETRTTLPYCVEVCPDGPCPGNTDPSQAYAGGLPYARDWQLPVPACWAVKYASRCDPSQAEIVVAYRTDPPTRTFVDVCCSLAPAPEQSCDDGLDNDEDCFVDGEDPDCEGSLGPATISPPSS